MSYRSRLFLDHLHAAYGGQGFFNPCMAFIVAPNSNDPLANLDRDHEILHAVMSMGTVGRLLFLCRYLTLLLWHAWAWDVKIPLSEIKRWEQSFDTFISSINRRWTAPQEGVAFRSTADRLTNLRENGNLSPEGYIYLQTIQDIIAFGPSENPIVRGWQLGEDIQKRFGEKIFPTLVSIFTDIALPKLQGGLASWLDACERDIELALSSLNRVAETYTKIPAALDSMARALQIKENTLPQRLWLSPTNHIQHYQQILDALLNHSDFPTGFQAYLSPLQQTVNKIIHGYTPRDFGISRICYFVDIEEVTRKDFPPRPKVRLTVPKSNVIDLMSDFSRNQLEKELDQLCAIDHYRRRMENDTNLLREVIRMSVPKNQMFTEILYDLIPFYKISLGKG